MNHQSDMSEQEEQKHCRELAVRHHVTLPNEHVRMWIHGDESQAIHIDNEVKTLAETFRFEREQATLKLNERIARSNQVIMDRVELLRILFDNEHMSKQVRELQGALTLKEEQLRAHRRVPLTDDQKTKLVSDLTETTKRVRTQYGLPTAQGLEERIEKDLREKAASILDDRDVSESTEK
jgi:CRISPR/Cas system CMR subunit Cmr4 (Cas7 group RAMP superfamily)